MIIAGHTLGTPGCELAEALALFRTAGLDAAEVIYQDDYPAAIRPSDKKSAREAAAIADTEGIPIVALTPYTPPSTALTRRCGNKASTNSVAASTLPTAWVRVLYDQANLTFTHDEEWREAFAVQGDLIGHVHLKDLVFKDPNAPFRASDTARVKAEERVVRSRVVGTGIVPWPDIIEELVGRGYDDVLTLEYEYRWHPQDLPEPAIGFKQAAAAVRRILSEVASTS